MSETPPSLGAQMRADAGVGVAHVHPRAIVAAFSFLTRLPIAQRSFSDAVFAASVAWFPLVGVVLGGAQVLVAWGLPALRYPATFAAVSVMALGAALTGGLHWDGLCDVFDGLGGGRGDRERSLAIMRDSRIGSFGALALVLVLLGKIVMLERLVTVGALGVVFLAPVVARAACALLIVTFPYARSAGLGVVFRAGGDRARALSALLVAVLAVGSVAWPLGSALVVSLLVAWLGGRAVSARLGGLTGDAYGAAIELSELSFLIVAWPLVGA